MMKVELEKVVVVDPPTNLYIYFVYNNNRTVGYHEHTCLAYISVQL